MDQKSNYYINGVAVFILVVICSIFSVSNAKTGFSALVIEQKTGRILYDYQSEEPRYPASLTKVMTLYVLFSELQKNRIRLNQTVTFSQNAVKQPPSKINALLGEKMTVDLAIRALVVKSANDVAIAIAELVGKGSEQVFVQKMNQTAKKLGMHKTHFVNPHGLFDENQISNTHDLAILTYRIKRDFPMYFHYFALTEFPYKEKIVESHNNVLKNFEGATGLKTGYVKKSGFNLITTSKRNGKELTGIVLGGKTPKDRDFFMTQLLDLSYDLLNQSYLNRQVYLTPNPEIMIGSIIEKPLITSPTIKITSLATTSNDKQTALISKSASIKSSKISSKSKYMLQVGAFKDKAKAQSRANSVNQLIGKTTTLKKINTNLYKVIVMGFDQKGSAQQACQKIKNKNIDCFIYLN